MSPAHPHPAFKFQLASSQCPLSIGEPHEAVTPERHSTILRSKSLASLGDNNSESFSVGHRLPRLVDDDTSSGEEEGSTLVRHEADSLFENRGEGKGSATGTARPIQTDTVHRIRSGLIGSTLSGSSGRHPSKPPLIPLGTDKVERASMTHLDVQAAKLRETITRSVLRDTPNYHGTVPVAHRTVVGAWNPTARSVCSMLHSADIRNRWEAVVRARLRK